MGVLAGGCELGKLHKYQCRTSVRIIGAHLELGAPAGGIRLPIARARAEPTRTATRLRDPSMARLARTRPCPKRARWHADSYDGRRRRTTPRVLQARPRLDVKEKMPPRSYAWYVGQTRTA